MQSQLFERPRLSGLVQADAIVTPDEEQVLMASIDAVGLSPFQFHGWLGKRLTASFGWNYDFDTARFAPTEPISGMAAAVARQGRTICRPSSRGSRPGATDSLRRGSWDRLAPRSPGIRTRGRYLARRACDDAVSQASARRRVWTAPRLSCRQLDLSSEWRSAPPVGAQHRRDGTDSWSITFRSLAVWQPVAFASSG